MSLSNKELLDKIKDEVWSHTYPFGSGEWKSGRNDDLWPIVCERYATEKAKELQAFKELFEAFFADFQERYAFQVPYNGTSEFYNQKKIEQSEAFKIDMKFAWDKIVLKKEF